MLRSRGATVLRVVAIAAVEAAILGLAALVAPFLASGIVALLGKTGTFEEVSGGRTWTSSCPKRSCTRSAARQSP